MKNDRLITSERQWDIFFYLCLRKSVGIDEIEKLFNGEWTKRTLQRDLNFLVRYGVIKYKVRGDYKTLIRYKYEGPAAPFLRRKDQKFCISCRDFLDFNLFGTLKSSSDNLAHQCLECKSKISTKSYYANHEYNTLRNRRRWRKKHPEAINRLHT